MGLLAINSAVAQVPQLINYQGRVSVGSTNFNGSGQFAFALVNTNGSSTYWSNDGTSTAGARPTSAITLTVTQGLYSLLLGDATITNMTAIPASVFNNSDVRLRVWFNDGTHGWQLLSPDQRIAAVGYAMVANAAQTVPASGILGTVATATNFTGMLGGDVSGLQGSVTIGSLHGIPLSPAAPALGQVLLYNGSNWAPGSLAIPSYVAGNGLALSGNLFSNTGVLSLAGGGGITISGANGNVTLGSNGTNLNTPSTLVARDGSGNFNAGTINAVAFNGSGAGLTNLSGASVSGSVVQAINFTGALGGDVSGSQGSVTVGALHGIPVAAAAPALGQVLLYNGSNWAPGSLSIPSYAAGNGLALSGNLFSNTGVLSLAGGGGITVSGANGSVTLGSNATDANTPSTLVARDGSGNFSAGTINAVAFNGNGAGLTGVSAAPSAGSSNYIQNSPAGAQSASFNVTGSGQVGGNLSVNGTLSAGGVTIANGAISPQIIPAGSIMAYMGTTAPSGWLLCDGSALSRTTYASLFAVLGTGSGSGDGSTTFNLPDMRGMFLRGVDGGAGRDTLSASRTAANTGGNAGNAVGSIQVPYNNILPPHNHGITDPGIGNAVSGTGSTTGFLMGTGTLNHAITTGISVNANGNGPTGGETHPLNIYVNYIIKY